MLISPVWREVRHSAKPHSTAVNRRRQLYAESMVARQLQRRASNKPTVGHRAGLIEEAFDHHCANAGWTAHDAGPAFTQRCSSLLCYLGTTSTPFTAWPENSQIYFSLETYISYSGNNYTFFSEGNISIYITIICWQFNSHTASWRTIRFKMTKYIFYIHIIFKGCRLPVIRTHSYWLVEPKDSICLPEK